MTPLPTSDPYLERNLTWKGGQANWPPSLGLWGSASLHCTAGAVSSLRRPSLVASLYLEGPSHECGGGRDQVLEQMACLSVHESGGGGYLVLSRRVARATTTFLPIIWNDVLKQSVVFSIFKALSYESNLSFLCSRPLHCFYLSFSPYET